MQLDLDTITKLFSIGLSLAAMVYAFFANRKKDTDERFKEGSKRMDRHDGRIASLEQKVQDLPRTEDLHAVQLELAKLAGSLGQVSTLLEANASTMSRQENTLNRLEEYLLNGGRKT